MKTLTFRPSRYAPDIISDLRKLAENDHRTLNAYIEVVLLQHIKASTPKNIKTEQKQGYVGQVFNEYQNEQKQDFTGVILKEYQDAYMEIHNQPYIIVTPAKDRAAISSIISITRLKNTTMDENTIRLSLKGFFKRCLTINDDWLRLNMSPAIIRSHFNKIVMILKSNPEKTAKLYQYNEAIKIAMEAQQPITNLFKSVPVPGKKPLWIRINDNETQNNK